MFMVFRFPFLTVPGLVAALSLALTASRAPAQESQPAPIVLKAEVVEDEPAEGESKPAAEASTAAAPVDAAWRTQSEARTITLSIPAPRGQITDRHGTPLAQNRVVYYLALSFPFIKNATNEQILAFAQEKMGKANQLLDKRWTLDSERLITHYRNRRWLPLVFSVENGLNVELSNAEIDKMQPLTTKGSGLVLHPAYIRYYPKEDTACHVIGYTSRVRALPLGPIADGDPMFEELEGKSGLEASFNRDLTGTPGSVNMLFSADGELLAEEVLQAPVPGRNVVTTLDFNIQKYAENALKKGARNGGSFVIMDVKTGDILALASNPGFDLNAWIPGIKPDVFQKLNSDPMKPLYPRATHGQYPPASTFKIVTVLGALESGKITESSMISCPTSYFIGNRYFHNHSKNDEGRMNAVNALKRSCNTWMYQAALQAGADPITSMAMRLGFGERTGIPLPAEGPGLLPTNARKMEQRGSKLTSGELANISIGQGEVEATPLQVCQSMAALADGENLVQPRLVLQIQDVHDRVVMAEEVRFRRRIDLDPSHRETVVKGMVAVVSGGGGTGHSAAIKHAQVAGKTGTAQWRPAKNQNLAWFTGFLPANNPVYAFAVLYEGRPNETVSGGRLAAPMVREVFNNIYDNADPDDPLVQALKDAPPPIDISSRSDSDGQTPPPSAAPRPAEQVQAAEPVDDQRKRGFLRRLFGR
jgi:penicillin-binding protein 2